MEQITHFQLTVSGFLSLALLTSINPRGILQLFEISKHTHPSKVSVQNSSNLFFFFFLQRFYTEQLCYFHSSSLRALSAAYVADLFTLTTEYISRFYKMNTGLQRMPQILGFNSCSSLVMYMGHIKDVLITHQDWFYWRVHRKEPTQNHRQLSPHSLQSCCGGEWCGAPLQW